MEDVTGSLNTSEYETVERARKPPATFPVRPAATATGADAGAGAAAAEVSTGDYIEQEEEDEEVAQALDAGAFNLVQVRARRCPPPAPFCFSHAAGSSLRRPLPH